jgi:hypothetical protein
VCLNPVAHGSFLNGRHYSRTRTQLEMKLTTLSYLSIIRLTIEDEEAELI